MGKRHSVPKKGLPETQSGKPESFLRAHAYWLFPFALFLIVRLFSGDANYLLAGDQCTFLELARTFPKHQLFNHELYLIHSPLFGYTIGLLHLILPLLASGLVAVLLFACANFFVIRSLGRFENLPRAAICAGLLYLAISRPAVAYDSHVSRVSILVCSNALALYAFLRMLEKPGRKMLLQAVGANAFALLVSDQGLALLPCEALLFLAHRPRAWRPAVSLEAYSVIAALIWPVVRLVEFSRRANLPAGISGTIEFTKNFPWVALLQPNFLPFTNAHRSLYTQTSLSLGNLRSDLLTGLPADLLLTPRWMSVVLLLVLVAAALVQRDRRTRAILWLGMTMLFLLPAGVGMNEWYSMGFVAPFALLIMEGVAVLTTRVEGISTVVLSGCCVLSAVVWLAAPDAGPHNFLAPRGGTHFLFTRHTVTRTAEVSGFFAPLPREVGIMGPTDLTPELVYLTDKRVVAIPFDPALLDEFIKEYKISYVITSNDFLRRKYKSPLADRFTGAVVTRYLAAHPERYRVVQGLRERYPAFYDSQDYFVLQVQ